MNFDDGTMDPKWVTAGSYNISSGTLNMYKGMDDGHTNSWIRLYRPGEIINYLSADIMYKNNVPQIAGLALQWWQGSASNVTGMQLHLKLNAYNNQFFASLDSTISNVRQNLGMINFDSLSPNQGWNSLSIAFHSDYVTVGINNNYMNIFNGLYHNPSNFMVLGDALVQGSDGQPNINYYVDNIKAVSQTAPVPIPAAVWLLGSGLVGLVGVRRKFSK